MIVINTVNAQRFSLNGIEYFKNYLSYVAGDSVAVYNAYDRRDIRVELTHFSQFEVNGDSFTSAADLQAALLDVIYTRATLGTGLPTTLTQYPIPFPQLVWKAKGVGNSNLTTEEAGDVYEGWADNFTYWIAAIWNGGSKADRNNFTVLSSAQAYE